MTLVIDTNIIVSALLSPDGRAARLFADVLDGAYTVLMTEEILTEYVEVLQRDKFNFDENIVDYIIHWFEKNAVWIEPQKSNIDMPDEKDRIFYDTAKCYKARLVTGNIKHYPVDELVTALTEFSI